VSKRHLLHPAASLGIAGLLGLLGLPACRDESAPTSSDKPPATQTAAPSRPAQPAVAPRPKGKPAVELTWDQTRPPAPSKEGFGVVIGQTTRAEVEALTEKLGLTCGDASPATVSRAAREARLARMQAEAKEKGTIPDIVSAASAARPSRYEAIPQVRYSCQNTPGTKLTDIQRPGATGRLLFVLDSANHPLRHVSFQRTHDAQPAALADMLATVAAYRERLGEPSVVQQDLPASAGQPYEFPLLTNVVREWQFKDFRVKVAALRGNSGKVILYENVEVPAALAMEPLAQAPAAPAGSAAPAQAAQAAQPKP
jgi:hypothetical protein